MIPIARRLSAAESDDVEALQTDIMRFMAILGFCLMVIFAMVQSLPQSEVQHEPQIVSKEILEQELKELLDTYKNLEAKVEDLKEKEQNRRSQLEVIAKKVDSGKEDLALLQTEISSKVNDLLTVRSKISKQEAQAESVSRAIEQLEKERDQKIQKEKEEKLRKLREKPQPIEKPKPEQTKVEVPQKSEPPPKAEKKKGLSLRFASDETLLSLIERGVVKFYLSKNGQYFRVTKTAIKLEPLDAQFYQMSSYTVPNSLIKQIKRKFTVTRSTLYGVTLNNRVQSQLSKYVSQQKSGELVINSDQSVTFLK